MDKTEEEIYTYIRLLYGEPAATHEYISRLPEAVLRDYLKETYLTNIIHVVPIDRVIFSLGIPGLENNRLKRLERILREYHCNQTHG